MFGALAFDDELSVVVVDVDIWRQRSDCWWLGDEGQGGRRTFMNSFICLRSMRAWNSRCSEALSPSLGEAVRIGYVIFHILPAMPMGINRDSSRMGELLTRPYLCIGWGG